METLDEMKGWGIADLGMGNVTHDRLSAVKPQLPRFPSVSGASKRATAGSAAPDLAATVNRFRCF